MCGQKQTIRYQKLNAVAKNEGEEELVLKWDHFPSFIQKILCVDVKFEEMVLGEIVENIFLKCSFSGNIFLFLLPNGMIMENIFPDGRQVLPIPLQEIISCS